MPKGVYFHKPRTEETKDKIRTYQTGRKKPWFTGRKLTDEHKDKISKGNKGKKKSEQGRINMSNSHRGEKNHSWKGGITPLVRQIRGCFKYRQWRCDVYTKDYWTCQICGHHGGKLEAHHLKEFHKIMEENNIKTLEEAENCEELWDINNGQTLCPPCHNKTKKNYK